MTTRIAPHEAKPTLSVLTLSGDRHDEAGFRPATQLHRAPFAGWGIPRFIIADAWMRPLRFAVTIGGRLLTEGDIEPVRPIDPGEVFAVEVRVPRLGGETPGAPLATLVVHNR